MSSTPPRPRPRRITLAALGLAWVSVSLVLFMLSRPVRAWAGERWGWWMLGATLVALLGVAVSVGLWEQRHWWWVRRSEDSW